MFFRRFFRFILVLILLFGMFGVLSSNAYRSGWSQGFASGQAVDGQPVESVPNVPPQRAGGFFSGIFGLFWWAVAAFFKFWFFVFFIGLIFRLIFGGRRGRHFRGPWRGGHGGHWGGWHHWKHNHDWKGKGWRGQDEKGSDFKGQRPPWFDDSDGEPVMKA